MNQEQQDTVGDPKIKRVFLSQESNHLAQHQDEQHYAKIHLRSERNTGVVEESVVLKRKVARAGSLQGEAGGGGVLVSTCCLPPPATNISLVESL